MTQEERRKALIALLQKDMPQYAALTVPQEETAQRQLLRSLMNVRPPIKASQAYLTLQDEYLQAVAAEKGVTAVAALPPAPLDTRLSLWQGDITTLNADAIVNAANSALLGCFSPCHGCIDNVIHTYAGVQLRLACSDMMHKQGHEEPTGRVKITPAYNLPSKYVLHTVGPIIETGHPTEKQKAQLASCYRSCLEAAAEAGCKSIAFCCISTGVFMFPNQLAAEIAVKTVRQYLAQDNRIGKVIFNVFKDKDKDIYEALLGMKE